MSDMKDLLARWEKEKYTQNEKKRESVASEAPKLREALLALGITKVTAAYDGQGDSGSMEEVEFDKDISHLDEHDYFRSQTREMLYNLLDCRDVGDWINNDGGFGSFVWDVVNNKLHHEHHQRIMSTEDSEFEGWEC